MVYEHISGGGFAGKPLPVNVLCEGYAMLQAVVADFKAAGHTVTTTLDSRIAALKPPLLADLAVSVASGDNVKSVVRDAASSADAALIVAPESNGTLQSIVEIVKETSALSLNSSPAAIQEAADKAALCHRVKALGIAAPETVFLDTCDGVCAAKKAIRDKLGLPIVIKPFHGVSCGGLSLIKNWGELDSAMKKTTYESLDGHFLAQEFIRGVAASVSLIANGEKVLAVSLNKQNIALGTSKSDSCYEGGVVPLDSALSAEAFAAAEKTVASFKSIVGHVGVDLVLTEEQPFVIEINPRMTTSVVGLRKVADFNPAQAVLDVAVNHELPTDVQTRGYAFFSKTAVPNPTTQAFQRTCQMEEVASPPFPVAENGTAYALIQSYGSSLDEAALKLREAEKRVRCACGGRTS